MPEKSWKIAERKIAEWLTVFAKRLAKSKDLEPPSNFKRNGQGLNASDRSRNSDVDAIHPCLSIKRFGSTFIHGITVEVTRRMSGLARLYTVEEDTFVLRSTSKRVLFTTLDGFESVYAKLTDGHTVDLDVLPCFHVSRLPSIIVDKLAQSLRYGSTKRLFPIVAFRSPRRPIKIAVDVEVLGEAYKGISGFRTKVWN